MGLFFGFKQCTADELNWLSYTDSVIAVSPHQTVIVCREIISHQAISAIAFQSKQDFPLLAIRKNADFHFGYTPETWNFSTNSVALHF